MESIPENNTPLLVVDDDEGLLFSIKANLVSAGMPEPAVVSDSRRVMEMIRQHRYQVVMLDLIMPHISGLEVLEQIKAEFPHIECIIVTAIDDLPTAVKATRMGAYDYMVKPLNSERLLLIINRALEKYSLRQELSLFGRKQSFRDLSHPEAFKDLVAEDESMALVFRQVEAVAPTDYSVIINGESGTGKEMLARAIHRLSHRSNAPFYAVNMAAFSKNLFEAEFFGHTKGAYTDARQEKRGFFEEARGGTLFLDEITELDPSLQGKLLRVIEERELYRLGSTTVRDVDVRIVAATNRDINEEIKNGRFRVDLFYRLNMYHIKVPPLRERKNDILPLARHFLKKYAETGRKDIRDISRDLVDRLMEQPFTGNVRELENLIAGAVILESGTELTLASTHLNASPSEPEFRQEGKLVTLQELEKRHILRALKETGGNRKEAARILGVNTTTVYRKIERYRIEI